MSIRTRIAISGGAVIFFTLLVFNVILLGLFARNQLSDRDSMLSARAQEAVASLEAGPTEAFTPRQILTPTDLGAGAAEVFVEILNADGRPIWSSGEINGAPPALALRVLQDAGNAPALVTTAANDVGLRISILPWTRPDLGLSGYLVAGQPTLRVERQIRGLRHLLWLSSAFTLLAAFVASWSVAGRALRPLKTMSQAADEIGATQDLSQRLPNARRSDEIGRLTVSFNTMVERLQAAHRHLAESLTTQRRFVADASHELRTPLTTIRSNAEFLLARTDVTPQDRAAALHDIAAESERMSRLVDDLLALARADDGQRLERAALDVRPLVRDLVRQAQRLHSSRTIHLAELDPRGPICVVANADALTQLVWILIDNAVKHTHPGGRIEIGLIAGNNDATLIVRDDGPGIAPADVDHIFERFYQADPARTTGGAGLGLAIARWIVDQHGGRISARNNDDHGATFTVELPSPAPGSSNS